MEDNAKDPLEVRSPLKTSLENSLGCSNERNGSRDCATKRATSCQLTSQNKRPPRENTHRASKSIDLGTTQLHICWSSPRSESCKSEQYFSKSDKKQEGVLKLVSQIAVLFFLVSGAFFAGYSIAGFPLDAKSARSNQDTEHWGKVARQLSHQEAKTGSVVIAGMTSSAKEADTSLRQSKGLIADGGESISRHSSKAVLFVTWIAFGDFGDGGFHTHNFHKVDMRWAEVARLSHPGCKIGLIMDQETLLADSQNVDFLHRLTIDKKVYGRNEYNDYYHWRARSSFLEKLMAEGEDKYNVVFLDPDVLVVGNIEEVFDHTGFDYATTISENVYQPINGAMHFVRAHRYGAAVDVLKGVLSLFQLRPDMGFTAGQQAYADFFELTAEEELVKQMQDESVEKGIGCHSVKEGDFNICFFICTKYNFWEDCSDHPAMQVEAGRPEDYAKVDVKVFHFVAYRKLGMQWVYDAFMSGGLEQARKAWAELPHDEDGFDNDPKFAQEA